MARRATSLGPKPSLVLFCLVLFCFFFPFLSLLLIDKKHCFPSRKGHFLFIFNVSLSFSLNLFWPPPFSVSLSLSLSFSCLSFFLLVFLFAFCVSCFCLFFIFLSSLLLFHEKNNMTIFNCNCFPEIFSLSFGFLSCFFFPIPFSYLCFS